MNIADMKEFVANDLKIVQSQQNSLILHIGACEVINRRKTASGDLQDLLQTEHGKFIDLMLMVNGWQKFQLKSKILGFS